MLYRRHLNREEELINGTDDAGELSFLSAETEASAAEHVSGYNLQLYDDMLLHILYIVLLIC